MSFQIEDGSGKGYRAKVNRELRLLTRSSIQAPQYHAALEYERAFQCVSGVRTVASPSTYGLLALKNNGDNPLAVTYIRVGVDRAETLQALIEISIGGTWVAGTAASVVNTHAGSSYTPLVDAHYNTTPTGASTLDRRWAQGPEECVWNKEGSIILPNGGVLSIQVTTESSSVDLHGRVSFIEIMEQERT